MWLILCVTISLLHNLDHFSDDVGKSPYSNTDAVGSSLWRGAVISAKWVLAVSLSVDCGKTSSCEWWDWMGSHLFSFDQCTEDESRRVLPHWPLCLKKVNIHLWLFYMPSAFNNNCILKTKLRNIRVLQWSLLISSQQMQRFSYFHPSVSVSRNYSIHKSIIWEKRSKRKAIGQLNTIYERYYWNKVL